MKKRYLKLFEALLFVLILVATQAHAQTKNITGTVKDDQGIPIPGATVSEKGKPSNGTSTTENGNFSLSVTPNATLVFKSIGFATKEMPIGSSSSINIVLNTDSKDLSEVVVTALGIKKEKKSLGYASTTIKTTDVANDGSPLNALSALYGQAPGLRLTATALGPSGGLNVNIRNAVALFEGSSTRPLFVIDGIPMLDGPTDINRSTGNGLNDLNMNDIESFEILKGAKAAVLYGQAGANGVILITSKKGTKKDGLGIDFNYSRSFDKPWIQQKFQNEYGSGFPAAWLIQPTDKDGFFVRNGQQAYYPTTYNFGPKLDGRQILWYDNQQRPYIAQPDNIAAFYQNGFTNNANVAIQGGSELGGFRVSYTRNDYKGIFQGYNLADNKFLFNGNINITKNVKFSLVSTYINTASHNSPAQNQDALVTYGVPRNLDVDLFSKENIIDPETGYYWWNMQNRITQNPIGRIARDAIGLDYFWKQNQNSYDNTREHFINSATVSINLAKGLNLETLGGFDYITNDGETREKVVQPLTVAGSGNFRVKNDKQMAVNIQSLLNYNFDINSHFKLATTVGGVFQRNTSESISRFTRGGFIVRDWFSLSNSKIPEFYDAGDGHVRGADRLYAVLASAQLSYNDYLFFDVQGRNDWSSILPSANNSYFYPGISASFVYSEALKLPTWMSYGKLRASWADVGRPGPRYFSGETYNLVNYAGFPTIGTQDYLPPANLKPERKREFEIGLENRFFKNRLGFEFNVYTGTTYDQILPLSVAPSTGVNSIRINAGKISTTGFELNLFGTPIDTKDFKWNIVFNASQAKPKVKELDLGIPVQNLWGMQGAKTIAKVGEPYGQIVVNDYATDPVTGKRMVDGSGYYYNDATKEKVLGTVIPDAVGGVTNMFNYKGVSLDFNIDYSFGSTLVSQTNMYMIGNGSAENTLEGRDEAHGGLPYYFNNANQLVRLPSHNSAVPADSQFPYILHDGMILDGIKADGSPNDIMITAADKYSYYWRSFMDVQPDVVYKNDYIKLRNVSIGYTIPRKITSKWKIQNLNISAFANNLLYIYKTMPNVDAEAINGTNAFYENNAWPAVRSFGLSLKTSF